MTQFVGTHFGKLDRKGRISVPAPFRAELEAASVTQLAFRISHQYSCIEARSRAEFDGIAERIRALPLFSEEREAWEAGFLAVSQMLRVDAEGRLILPEEMVAEAGLAENVAFLGKGDRFEIWDAATARAHTGQGIGQIRDKRMQLPAFPLNTTPRGVA
jgi:MraZ protein